MGTLGVALGASLLGCGGKAVVDPQGTAGTGGAGQGGSGNAGQAGSGQGGQGGGQCGDPTTMAMYPTCAQATDQGACEAAGGTWEPVGLYPEPVCQCPTGDSDCACTKSSACLAGCIAQTTSGPMGCDGVTEGHCSSVSILVGCWCIFNEGGQPEGFCID
jgi:hypothetical protein